MFFVKNTKKILICIFYVRGVLIGILLVQEISHIFPLFFSQINLCLEDENEFEPTVEMIMNEFDDERTIEEEEELGQEDEQEEINALEKEQDMPIEELLKLYGYKQPEKKVEEEEDEEEGEEEQKEESPTERSESEPETEARGEKRSFSTSPPVKKPKSELARLV